MKKIEIRILLVVLFSVMPSVHAAFVPTWQGLEGTTNQQWNFTNNDNPAAPDVIDNDYGSASATITVGAWGSGWFDNLGGELGGMMGFWDIGDIDGSIVLEIDNSPLEPGQKEVWVQVTYYQSIGGVPTIDIPGAQFTSSQTVLVEEDAMMPGMGWYLDQSIWQIVPNLPNEQVVITGNTFGSQIGQVIVDTYVIPEPASMALLALGGLAVLRKRKQV